MEETFTFRITSFQNWYNKNKTDSWFPNNGDVSFSEGALVDIPNAFALRVQPEPIVEPDPDDQYPYYYDEDDYSMHPMKSFNVYCSSHLASASKLSQDGVHVTGIQCTFTEDGDVCSPISCKLTEKKDNADVFSPSGRLYRKFFSLPADAAGEIREHLFYRYNVVLKIEITVLKPFCGNPTITKPQFINTAKYFLSTNLSDVSIKCGNETFPAHVFVLGDNSPVFAKMFEHEMKESNEKSVEIKDAEPNLVREMLSFFYTGSAENSFCVDVGLYHLADKYMVDSLKTKCVLSLVHNVKMENALDMYCFGRRHEIDILVKEAETVLAGFKNELVKDLSDLLAILNSVPPAFSTDLFQLLWSAK